MGTWSKMVQAEALGARAAGKGCRHDAAASLPPPCTRIISGQWSQVTSQMPMPRRRRKVNPASTIAFTTFNEPQIGGREVTRDGACRLPRRARRHRKLRTRYQQRFCHKPCVLAKDAGTRHVPAGSRTEPHTRMGTELPSALSDEWPELLPARRHGGVATARL